MKLLRLNFHILILSFLACEALEEYNTLIEEKAGDLIIGGLFRVYFVSGEKCETDQLAQIGIQQMEAFRYAIKQINAMRLLPNNLTFGWRIYDSCYLPIIKSIEGMKVDYLCDQKDTASITNGTLIAIAGAISSYVYNIISGLSFHCVTILSSLATATKFSSEVQNPYFLRTIASDYYQSLALIKTAQSLGFKNGILLYEQKVYSEGFKGDLWDAAKDTSVDFCFADIVDIPFHTKRDWDKLFREMEEMVMNKGIDSIFLAVGYNTATDFFNALEAHTDTGSVVRRMQVFGGDGWTKHYKVPKNHLSHGSIGLSLSHKRIPQFDAFMEGLTIATTDNVLLKRLIANQSGCSLDENTTTAKCSGSETIKELETSSAHLIVSALDVIAYAMAEALTRPEFSGNTLRRLMGKVKIKDSLTNFQFYRDTNGGAPHYTILQLQENATGGGGYEWNTVGGYHITELTLNKDVATKRVFKTNCVEESLKECNWKCFHFYTPKDPEMIVFTIIAVLGIVLIALLAFLPQEKRSEPLWTSQMPFLDNIIVGSCCCLLLCSTITWLPFAPICVLQKFLFSSFWALGSVCLAMKAQGTRRARAGMFEGLGLFTRNLEAAVLAQLIVILLVHILLMGVYFSLATADSGDFHHQGPHYYRSCSLFGPDWKTLFVYAVAALGTLVTLNYSVSLSMSMEPYLRTEGHWLLLGSLGCAASMISMAVLSYFSIQLTNVRLFAGINFISGLCAALSMFLGQGSIRKLLAKDALFSKHGKVTLNTYELPQQKLNKAMENENKETGHVILKAYSENYDYPTQKEEIAPSSKSPYSMIDKETTSPYSEVPDNFEQESERDVRDNSDNKSEVTTAWSEKTEASNLKLFLDNLPQRQRLTLQMFANSGFLGKSNVLIIEKKSGERCIRLTQEELETLIEEKHGEFPPESGTYASIITEQMDP